MIVKRMHDFVRWSEKQARACSRPGAAQLRARPAESRRTARRRTRRVGGGPGADVGGSVPARKWASRSTAAQVMPSFHDYFATVQESLSPTSALPADSTRLYAIYLTGSCARG